MVFITFKVGYLLLLLLLLLFFLLFFNFPKYSSIWICWLRKLRVSIIEINKICSFWILIDESPRIFFFQNFNREISYRILSVGGNLLYKSWNTFNSKSSLCISVTLLFWGTGSRFQVTLSCKTHYNSSHQKGIGMKQFNLSERVRRLC